MLYCLLIPCLLIYFHRFWNQFWCYFYFLRKVFKKYIFWHPKITHAQGNKSLQQSIAYLVTDIVIKEKHLFGIGHPTVPFCVNHPFINKHIEIKLFINVYMCCQSLLNPLHSKVYDIINEQTLTMTNIHCRTFDCMVTSKTPLAICPTKPDI